MRRGPTSGRLSQLFEGQILDLFTEFENGGAREATLHPRPRFSTHTLRGRSRTSEWLVGPTCRGHPYS